MSKNSFHAMNWLSTNSRSAIHMGQRQSISNQNTTENKFNPSSHLTPGWQGDSLASKDGAKLKKAFLILWRDAIFQITQLEKANKSLQNSVLQQFLIFNKQFKTPNLYIKNSQDLSLFWSEVSRPSKERCPCIDKFVKSFGFKAVCLYLYKVKFLGKVADTIELPLSEEELQNPNFSLNKFFKKGSCSEIHSEALERNAFSWFRPSVNNPTKLRPLKNIILSLSITEFMKITSVGNYLEDLKQNYSHSFSHKSFGVLLNELLVSLPTWFLKNDVDQPPPVKSNKTVPVSTKFVGDQMSSICQSHWLAQELNLNPNWKYVICPEFRLLDDDDNFLKLTHELQFLTFLCDYSIKIKHPVIKFISETWKNKTKVKRSFEPLQTSLFNSLSSENSSPTAYDRLVINLLTLPKKNPHHYLVQKINNQIEEVNEQGFLYVFSNQKLFVNSQVDRVNQLLKHLELKAEINFSGLKGKGEIQNHLYIFQKRPKSSSPLDESKKKKTFISFSWEGELNQFNMLNEFSKELFDCFETKHPSTPFYLNEITTDTVFRMNQEIILNGKILQQSENTDNQITHPNFIKNLTSSTKPLEYFFKIESLSESEEDSHSNSLFMSSMNSVEEKYNYVLIVHLPNGNAEQVEIIPSSTYIAKKENYGVAYYQYFGLTPKISSLNINMFREFFDSNIGQQIIQITLTGGQRKVRSRVSSLLVPGYFEYAFLPINSFDTAKFQSLTLQGEEFVQSRLPKNETLEVLIEDLTNSLESTPGALLGLLSNLKVSSKIKYDRLSNQLNEKSLNLKNTELQSKLVRFELRHLLNGNEDIFIDFQVKNKALLARPLSKVELEYQDKEDSVVFTLFSDSSELLKIYTGLHLANFLNFLFSNYCGHQVDQLLQGVKVPSLEDLNSLYEELYAQRDRSKYVISLAETQINRLVTSRLISN